MSKKPKTGKITRDLIKRAWLDSIPVMAGYVFIGIGFGMIMEEKGMGVLWVIAMSVIIYSGAMQFVTINLISGGASLLTTATTALMVSARHLFYSISMIDKYKNTGAKKAYLIYALTDETYSLLCQDKPMGNMDRHSYCLCISAFNQTYWIAGTVIGALFGSVTAFSTEGIDFAMTALFVSTFVQQWMDSRDRTSAICGLAVSLICLLIFGPDGFLIPTMIGITASLTAIDRIRRRKSSAGGDENDS